MAYLYLNSVSGIGDESLIEIVITGQLMTEEVLIRPHAVVVHSYKAPTFCDFCGEMLFGLVRQGLKCEGCGLNFHKRCVIKVPNNCSVLNGQKRRSSTLNVPRSTSETGSTSSLISASEESGLPPAPSLVASKFNRSPSIGNRSGWFEKDVNSKIKIPHTFALHSYTRPTICGYCKKLLKGLFKQGVQCKDCQYNAHKKCIEKIPKDCPGESTKDQAGEYPDSGLGSEPERESCRDEIGEEDSDESNSPSGTRKLSIIEASTIFSCFVILFNKSL
ncbi:protein kinase C, mu, putative [Pediculus humanus corporis]|uniref:Protein kinase C, mu, putative n=1 Tax=Pediculus humanus subsp. corporis TaxID=121224 RepID=E0VJ54_PEDHC|nr:protein kinase C, mu, putative [Pediculus humanus corporis]EEB13410.1 protein kinase C, mu, putative [Pediculus humanus corporis]